MCDTLNVVMKGRKQEGSFTDVECHTQVGVTHVGNTKTMCYKCSLLYRVVTLK